MTTKDQAIADAIACFDAAEGEGLSIALRETSDDRLKDLVERRLMFAPIYLKDSKTAPDCRTCANYLPSGDVDGFKCTSYCIAGELYKPSRPVVLYRKES